MIDLHLHSTYSDGTLTPAELVALAADARLTAIALTDHDGTAGVAPLLEACAALPADRPLLGIPGVEISAESEKGSMHLLGYFIDCANEELQATLRRIREGRDERNERLLKRLREVGATFTWDDVRVHAGEDMVGRPHFAAAMVKSGMVKNRKLAFDRFLAKGKTAYIERYRQFPAEALRVIRAAGGVPVLAHPGSLQLAPAALRTRIEELKEMGLGGLEVYYPMHRDDQVTMLAGLARELDLVATGGSDFHGGANPDIRIGRGFGPLNVPDTVIDELRARSG